MLMKNLKTMSLLAIAACTLAACNSVNSSPNSEGQSSTLDWPNPRSTTFNKDRGTFPNVDSLKQIRSGMTKDQLYYLIGRPHFEEGFRVREWDYLFHFNTPGVGPNGVTTCQYKILFDSQKYARSFHWRAVDPVGVACPPQQPEPVAPPPQIIIREVVPTPVKIRQ